ncbi:PqqD family protein [Paenarthrobacter sp. NPDC089675]|uniref:PqqD family protein n=1 Tax=Paenarthrobacter sp. NPDC089675 TaxID=3364376 RepID=UPI00381DE81B
MSKAKGRIEDTDVFELAPKLAFNIDDDGLTVFDARGGMYWRGNGTAGDVLKGVGERLPVGSIITGIHTAYDVDASLVRGDVHVLLADLQNNGIVRKVRP